MISASACGRCGAAEVDPSAWRCGRCAGVLELEPISLAATTLVDSDHPPSRYRAWLGHGATGSLGEVRTPLVDVERRGRALVLKVESGQPTGSFKDRGAGLVASVLKGNAVASAVEDSSGNAGSSLAAYCARLGIELELFVPASASPAKVAQARSHGARISAIAGPRPAATEAAIAAAETSDAVYASHLWNPWFNRGIQTFAFELWEQLDHRPPRALVMPVGAGSLLLASHRAFRALHESGLIDREPALFGVQASAFAPLARAFADNLDDAVSLEPAVSAAEGILVSSPPRASAVLEAVRDTGGALVGVTEDDLWDAHGWLAGHGLLVEPTSAVALAGLSRLAAAGLPGDDVVVAITGHGLKSAENLPASSVSARAPGGR